MLNSAQFFVKTFFKTFDLFSERSNWSPIVPTNLPKFNPSNRFLLKHINFSGCSPNQEAMALFFSPPVSFLLPATIQPKAGPLLSTVER